MVHNVIDEALGLAASGQPANAVTRLEAGAAAGNVDALMQLAVWHLTGTYVPRNLDAARMLLRRAVAIGHVDGALMEIALAANGNGNAVPTDWQTARALLDIAAANDPVAAAQRELLKRMQLRPDGSPAVIPTPETLHDAPRVLRYRALLTPDECAHIASVGAALLEPAIVLDPATGRPMPHPIRTSDGGAIGPTREDLVVRAVNLRIAAASGTHVAQGEPLTVLRYRPGQQYRRHLDTIAGARNQRVKTALIYLNQGFGGGETQFPLLDLTIRPAGGDMILFDTVLPDGTPEPRALHAGLPVTAGAKWLATRWIRAGNVDPWTLRAD